MSDPKRQGSGPRWRWPPEERADPELGAALTRAFHDLLARRGSAALERRLSRLSKRQAALVRRRWLTNHPELLDRIAVEYDSTPSKVQRMERQALRRLGAGVPPEPK